MKSLIEFFIRRSLFGNLLSVLVIVGGILSLSQVRREMFPNVSYDIISVSLPFPGASAEEVEKLLMAPLELDLKEVDGIKKIQGYAIEGLGSIYLTLDPDQTSEREAKDDIQSVVDRFELPTNAEQIVVNVIKTKQIPIVEAGVSGDLSDVELRDYAKAAEKELEKLPGVARVVETSVRKKEIHVEVFPAKLQAYRLTLNDVIQSLHDQNVSIPGGPLKPRDFAEDGGLERIIRTIGEFKTPEDIGNTVIRSNDLASAIRVKDIAQLNYGLEPVSSLNRVDGKPSINLWILKKEKYDALNLMVEVNRKVEDINRAWGDKVKLSLFNDASVYIRNRLGVISGNFLMGISLVLILLMLMLPWKLALIVALGEPFALMGAIILFPLFDISINVISMIGIILVSGMLVDDSVLVCDNIYRKIEEGMDSVEAAVQGTVEVWPAVTASVAVILACFIPLMTMSGIFGKFVREIPLGAIIPLLVSLFEGLFILPAHVGHWIKKPLSKAPSASGKLSIPSKFSLLWDKKLLPRYENALRRLIRNRYKALMGVVGLIVVVGIYAVTVMNFVLFPKEGINIFYIRADAPTGTPLEETAKRFAAIEAAVAQTSKQEITNFTTLIGAQLQEPGDPARRYGSHYGQITVFLTPAGDRDHSAGDIQAELRKKIGTVAGLGAVRFEDVNPGPPMGKPIDVGVRGESFEEIMKSVKSIKAQLSQTAGVYDVQDNLQMGKEEIRVKLIPNEAAAALLTPAQVGTTVRAAFEGVIATSIQELEDEIDVRVFYREQDRKNLNNLMNLEIPNVRGNIIKLSRIATFERGQGIATYVHEGRRREIKVTADLDLKVTNSQKMQPTLQAILTEERKNFPDFDYVIGGEAEDTNESLDSLLRAFGYSIAFIFLVLVLLFKNLVQPLLILMVIPLGLVSSVLALAIHGQPLSFMALMGMIALGGVIANNAIVFVDFVNQLRGKGRDISESIIKTAGLRIRPIMLTSISNVVGVLPIAYGIGGEDEFVAVLALGLGWGLLVGSLLIAFVIPVGIAISDDVRKLFNKATV